MKKNIQWEESVYGKKVHKIKVDFPVYYVDEYGYTCYSEDGKTTVCIGLNGVQCKEPKTHSIETSNYFSGERYSKRKRDISISEWRQALNDVKKYVTEQINKTL